MTAPDFTAAARDFFISEAERTEIRERADKATPGPWVADHLDPKSPSWVEISQKCAVAQVFDGTNGSVATAWGDGNTGPAHPQQVPNADFIAHARTDVPRLLSALDAADQRERTLRQELAESEHEYERSTRRHLANHDAANAMLRSALGPELWSKFWGPSLEALGHVVDEVLAARDAADQRVRELEAVVAAARKVTACFSADDMPMRLALSGAQLEDHVRELRAALVDLLPIGERKGT